MQPRNPNNAKGIDVSNNNGPIDWEQVAAGGYYFAFAKATEGATYTDPTFAGKYKAIKAVGMLRGAYCFARPKTSSALDEADFYVDTVLKEGGFDDLPPMLDLEDTGGLNAHDLRFWVITWLSRVKARTGRTPILYTYSGFAEEHLSGLTEYPLFIADYGHLVPPDVAGWTHWTFFQHTETGQVPGHSGNIDLDEFAGTVDELKAFCEKGVISVQLQQGFKGGAVIDLQMNLNRVLGLNLATDGEYGPATTAAVKSFQQQRGMIVTGAANQTTLDAISERIRQLDSVQPKPQPPREAPAADLKAKIDRAASLLSQASDILKSI